MEVQLNSEFGFINIESFPQKSQKKLCQLGINEDYASRGTLFDNQEAALSRKVGEASS